MQTNVYIAGTGMTRFGQSKSSLIELIIEAAEKALKNSDLNPSKINSIVLGVQDAAGFTGEGNIGSKVAAAFAQHFDVKVPTATEVGAASASGATAVHYGYKDVVTLGSFENKGCYYTLSIGAEKMTHLPRERQTELIAKVIDEYGRKNGETMLSLAARVMEEQYENHGLTYADLDNMAAQLHLRAARNPNARFFGKYPTPKEIWAVLNDPNKNKVTAGKNYRLFHSTSTDDGAAAMVITSHETDIRIIGIGQGNAPMRLEERNGCYGFEATCDAAIRAFSMANLRPTDLFGRAIVEAHDAFLPYVFPQLVAMGFYRKLNDSVEAFRRGELNEDGILPVNISGGLKGRGHPLGASSLAQIVEIVSQMRGQAGELQLDRQIQYGISAAIGGFATANSVTAVENRNYHKN